MADPENKVRCKVKQNLNHGGVFYGKGSYEIREDHALAMARLKRIPWNKKLRELDRLDRVGEFEEPDEEPDTIADEISGDEAKEKEKAKKSKTKKATKKDQETGDSGDEDGDGVSAFLKNLKGEIPDDFPGDKALKKLGIFNFEKLPKTREDLAQLSGLGKATVEKIGLRFAQMEEDFKEGK